MKAKSGTANSNIRYGKVIKLSNHGWSSNERYFKMDQSAISYFSDVSTKVQDKIHSGKQKPKQSVPIKYVTDVCQFQTNESETPNDCGEVKKFKSTFDSQKAFKVVFRSAALIDGIYDPEKFNKKDESVKKSALKTWYLVTSQADHSNQTWINFYKTLTGQVPAMVLQSEESKRPLPVDT